MTKIPQEVAEEHWRLMAESAKYIEQSLRIMQGVSDAIIASHAYRVYLLDANGTIEAAESFFAEHQDDAVEVARSVFEASSDVFHGCEVWSGKTFVRSLARSNSQTDDRLEDATLEYQDTVANLEEKLFDAFHCVRRSRKLIEASAELRDRQASSILLT